MHHKGQKFPIQKAQSVTPGVGLEPTSPEGHQLACHYLISRLTPFRVYITYLAWVPRHFS
jgi:hypothetical protein